MAQVVNDCVIMLGTLLNLALKVSFHTFMEQRCAPL